MLYSLYCFHYILLKFYFIVLKFYFIVLKFYFIVYFISYLCKSEYFDISGVAKFIYCTILLCESVYIIFAVSFGFAVSFCLASRNSLYLRVNVILCF